MKRREKGEEVKEEERECEKGGTVGQTVENGQKEQEWGKRTAEHEAGNGVEV